MRWKLLRRRLSVSAPRMIVRSHLPWPLRWAVFALAFGFSAALALWAFEFGKDIAGLDRDAKEELSRLRDEAHRLRQDSQQARAIADTAGSLVKAERVAQERLAQQVRQLEAEKQALQADLGFFERLLPVAGEGLQLRGLQAEPKAPGQLRYQLLLMQSGKNQGDFSGRYEVMLSGTLDGKPWNQPMSGGPKLIQFKQYLRVEGLIDHPADAVLKTVQARIVDNQGAVRATQSVRF
jgi:hypothetical protein